MMRFGRRGKSRGRDVIFARRADGKSRDENLEVIPTDGSAAPAMDIVSEESGTATQEILTHLGRFSREWSSPENMLWSDASMNQLILCIEISIEEGWSDLTAVLSDTGRVLQTYENADRADGAIPFLEQAYDVMCRLVGDIVIEKSPQDTLDEWPRVFSEGVSRIEADGMKLFQDDDGEMVEEESKGTSFEQEKPIDAIEETIVVEAPEITPQIVNELPVLDELPPLESLVSVSSEPERVYVAEEESVTGDSAVDTIVDADGSEEVDMDTLSFASFDTSRVATTAPDIAINEAVAKAETENTEPDSSLTSLSESDDDAEVIVDELSVEVPLVGQLPVSENDTDSVLNESVEEPVDVYDPPRIVVDIIDRICDVLGTFESDIQADRSEGLDVLVGGLKALEHEAHLMENTPSEKASASMIEVCRLVHDHNRCWSERFLELSFSYCGIFIEALTEPESANVTSWQGECDDWLGQNTGVVAGSEKESGVVLAFPQGASKMDLVVDDIAEKEVGSVMGTVEDDPKVIVLSTEDSSDGDTLSWFTAESPEEPAELVEEIMNLAPGLEVEPAKQEMNSVEPSQHVDQSQALLHSAQEAALQGKGEEAKTFALRAAAEIAKSEVYKAEAELRGSEIKIKEGMTNTEEARAGVKSCEESVKDTSALVAESRSMHAESQSETARIGEQLDTLEEDVADLNRQIQELQAKRDEEVERISETVVEMDRVRGVEQQALNELAELSRLEDDGRARLEESRQTVKDRLRVVQVIESEMERARETLTQEKVSYADITQAIQQISGTSIQNNEGGEELLF